MGAFGENPHRLTPRGYDPAWTPDGEWVVFADRGIFHPGNLTLSGLAMVEVDDPTHIVEIHDSGYLPVVSPNGHRIAYFDSTEGGQRDIYTIPTRGGEPVKVTDDVALDWAPAWAPDGRRLYYSSDRGGVENIWYVEIDERSGEPRGEPQRAGASEVDQGWPSLSRNGQLIAYTSRRQQMNLHRVAFDPQSRTVVGEPQAITRGANTVIRFDLSPDGEWLVYGNRTGQLDIFLVRADGSGEIQRLTDDEHRDTGPRFSPDGRQIALDSDRGGSAELWLMDVESRNLTQLTAAGGRFVQDPVFSPDGSKLMYRVGEGDAYNNYLMSLDQAWDAQTPVKLPTPENDSFQPSYWSPNGSWVVGWTYAFLDPRLLLFDVERQTYEDLSDFRGHAHPAWLGDDYLVFVSTAETRGVTTRRDEMLVMDRRTGTTERLLGDGVDWTFEEQMVASPDGRWLYYIRAALDSDIWLLTRAH